MATHSSILAWKIPWAEASGSWGCKEYNMTQLLSTHVHARGITVQNCLFPTQLVMTHHGSKRMSSLLAQTGLGHMTFFDQHNVNRLDEQYTHLRDFPGGTSSKEPTCQCRRHKKCGFDRQGSSRRAWQPTSIFLPGESHGQRSLVATAC